MNREFKCLDCGYSGGPDDFGERVLCPTCKSHAIVDAELWDRFHGGKQASPATETQH